MENNDILIMEEDETTVIREILFSPFHGSSTIDDVIRLLRDLTSEKIRHARVAPLWSFRHTTSSVLLLSYSLVVLLFCVIIMPLCTLLCCCPSLLSPWHPISSVLFATLFIWRLGPLLGTTVLHCCLLSEWKSFCVTWDFF